MTTISETSRRLNAELAPRFGRGEASWMAREIMEDVFARSRTELLADGDKEASAARLEMVDRIVRRLLGGEPLQYILGYAMFMGMRFNVKPGVLIPRPETEQLVDLIVKREASKSDLQVLDACTGSGCIAVALARYLPFAAVTAVDISPEALAVAQSNVEKFNARNVKLLREDVLTAVPESEEKLDIVVSNPPYVMERERSAMESNVLDYEPEIALFVPDDDPLRFYRAICRYALKALKRGGRIYFEANPLTVDALADEMRGKGWMNVEIADDDFNRRRFLIASRA